MTPRRGPDSPGQLMQWLVQGWAHDLCCPVQFSLVRFSCSVVSNSLWPHGLQHARPPCPSPTPGAYSNSCTIAWHRGCHPTISSSVVPFSSRLQSFPALGSFPMSQFFASGGHSTGVSASTSVLPVNTQDWSPLGWTGWISLQSKGLFVVQWNANKGQWLELLRKRSFLSRGCWVVGKEPQATGCLMLQASPRREAERWRDVLRPLAFCIVLCLIPGTADSQRF